MEPTTLWHRALCDPQLQDLPFKIETNEHGQLVLSPHKPRHSRRQSRILRLLDDHASQPGEAIIEFAVETSKGIKVPDVVWISNDRLAQVIEDAEASPIMPELCIEVLSGSNTAREFVEKRQIYFEHGALEVWACDAHGRLQFYNPAGELSASNLVSSFPDSID